MSLAQSEIVVGDRPEEPARRARRVLSERTAARREKLRACLVEPGGLVDEVEVLKDRVRGISSAFKPRDEWQDWLAGGIATLMVRIDRCERVERKLRELASYRAIDFWEEDQAIEVETLASKVDRDPGRVVAKLRRTPAGLEWLLKRWRALATVEPAAWTDEQRALAGRLVGDDPDSDTMRPGFAAEAMLELEARRTRVEDADAILRGLVEADLSEDAVPGLAKLRRYLRSLQRQMTWYVDQFRVVYPDNHRADTQGRPTCFAAPFEVGDAKAPTRGFVDPQPRNDETKPFSTFDAGPGIGETKPTPAASRHGNDETKPIGRVELAAKLAEAVPQIIAEERVASVLGGEGSDQASRPEGRLKPAQEVARRQKAARRREALGCG